MTTPSESNPYASPSDTAATPFGPAEGNRSTVDNPEIVRALSGTRPWVLMLSILGMIGTALMGLGWLASVVNTLNSPRGVGPGVVEGLSLLLVAAVCLAASLYLFSYGRRIGNFLRTREQADLAAALLAQKSYWKLIGILAILYIGFVVLMIPFFLFLSVGTRSIPSPN